MSAVFANEARCWLGTPYLHQASVRGVGCDCLGLVRGVWRAVFGAEPEAVPPYTPDWSEPQGDEALFRAARRHMALVREPEMRVGDVLLFRMHDGAVAKHLGILSDSDPAACFIHAYAGHGVVESPLSDPWRRRIAACFRVSQG